MESPAWTDDDRALMLALAQYESSLCPGCGVEKRLAWHAEAEGWFTAPGLVCHSCSAQQGHEVAYRSVELDPALTPERLASWAPFDMRLTVTEPTQTSDQSGEV